VPRIVIETRVRATPQVCFDLARDVEAHVRSAGASGERAVGGVTRGKLGLGDTVTWEASHLGVRQRLTARVTEFDPPHRFVDEMVQGAFRSFRHVHLFVADGSGTVMQDDFAFVSPFGPLGRLADALFLEAYMRKFLVERARVLRELAETSVAP
jgi:ligand-binding SRPBCC domain-containing protein